MLPGIGGSLVMRGTAHYPMGAFNAAVAHPRLPGRFLSRGAAPTTSGFLAVRASVNPFQLQEVPGREDRCGLIWV